MTAPKKACYKDEDHESFERTKKNLWSLYGRLNKITAGEVIDLFESHGFKTLRQMGTKCTAKVPERLTKIYSKEVLETEQIVALFQNTGTPSPATTASTAGTLGNTGTTGPEGA